MHAIIHPLNRKKIIIVFREGKEHLLLGVTLGGGFSGQLECSRGVIEGHVELDKLLRR